MTDTKLMKQPTYGMVYRMMLGEADAAEYLGFVEPEVRKMLYGKKQIIIAFAEWRLQCLFHCRMNYRMHI